MIHTFEQKVYYSDTDAYGVVWHGSYLRWLEKGRVDWCEAIGHNLVELEEQNIVLPVTNLNIRYKVSAKLNDEIIVETFATKLTPLSITFNQIIKSKKDNKIFVQAQVDVVAINKEGKLYRRMPEILSNSVKEVIVCQD